MEVQKQVETPPHALDPDDNGPPSPPINEQDPTLELSRSVAALLTYANLRSKMFHLVLEETEIIHTSMLQASITNT